MNHAAGFCHEFIELAAEAINRQKRLALVDGIKYQRLGDEHYYAQELFEQEELTGYLKSMLEETQKSVYEHVIYDSDTERSFADQLEKNDAVRVYAKLPGWFKVPTPLGSYNPDWAVLLRTEDGERLYFVVETKGGLFTDDLRDREGAKIACGKAHFGALRVSEPAAEYVVARSLEDVLQKATVEMDVPKRKALYGDLQKKVTADVAFIYMPEHFVSTIYRDGVKNMPDGAMGAISPWLRMEVGAKK